MKATALVLLAALASLGHAADQSAPSVLQYDGVIQAAGLAYIPGLGTVVSDGEGSRLALYNSQGVQTASLSATAGTLGPLNAPAGMALDANGALWVADSGNHRILKVAVSAGSMEVQGSLGWSLSGPMDVAAGADGRLYVADSGNNRVAVFNSADGSFLYSIGHLGYSALDEMAQPMGVEVYGNEVYVADAGNGRVLVFDLDGQPLRQLGQRGNGPGRFDSPFDVAVDQTGQVWVLDNGTQSVQVLSWDGTPITGYGNGFDTTRFEDPSKFFAAADGKMMVADGYAHSSYTWVVESQGFATFGIDPAIEPVVEVVEMPVRLEKSQLLAGPVPARAGEALHVVLPRHVERLSLQLFSVDGRSLGKVVENEVREGAYRETAGLDAGVYLIKVVAEDRTGQRQENLQKVIITR